MYTTLHTHLTSLPTEIITFYTAADFSSLAPFGLSVDPRWYHILRFSLCRIGRHILRLPIIAMGCLPFPPRLRFPTLLSFSLLFQSYHTDVYFPTSPTLLSYLLFHSPFDHISFTSYFVTNFHHSFQ